ncbi:MAG: NADH-quinone oxidoreductase chain j [Planctomycetaceae bacterium]|nr:MAG: NADH-quinone oxidoreductase chain j [Planctomycetaceae bacterium]
MQMWMAALLLAGLGLWGLLTACSGSVWHRLSGVLAAAGGLWLVILSGPRHVTSWHEWLFYPLACGVLTGATLTIVDRNPVYAALWFALATLSTCGIFVLNMAAFLAAATVIVYAGAIIVMFLFVIMLAQQSGRRSYDQHSFRAGWAVVAGSLLLGIMIAGVKSWSTDTRSPHRLAVPESAPALRYSQPQPLAADPTRHDLGTLMGVGRSLFGDYLLAVELAGTLLLVATIGTIVLAPRRS